jgi:hypothetical protein
MLGWWLSLSTGPFKPGAADYGPRHHLPKRAGSAVVASSPRDEAIQPEPGALDCFASLAMTKNYVSTSPVLEPLAAESFRPCGSAR